MTEPQSEAAADQALWIEVIRRKMDVLEARVDRIDEALSANDERTARIDRNTSELVSLLQSWKGAIATAEMVGKVMKPLAAIVGALVALAGSVWGVFQMVKGGGK
jgi:hypothetical protein